MKHFGLIPNQHQYFGLYIRIVPIYIIKFRSSVVSNADLYNFFLLSIGAVSACLENVLRKAEFIADIYQQVPHCYKFIIHPEAQQQFGDSFHIIYSSCVL